MILNLNNLQDKSVESTTTGIEMKLSDSSDALIFQMFINNKYSNPIGSVVREITSNCFDSHVEAGVSSPVLIKKSFDEESNNYRISFVDFGMGLSPDRIKKIYGVLFESTKRSDNSQIGGFGIGSKTPLAYKRKIGYGSTEYDNSFFVVTNYNGIKYYYCIYELNYKPVINPLYEEPTDEINGTEVIIPVLKSDIDRFENEIVKQLYYFENIVFEGFTNQKVTNEYTILDGKNFLFRGYDVSKYVHVCLGRVAYKIDYGVLDLYENDYQFPVALKFEIGDLTVNDSREQLDYSEGTIKILKQKLKDLRTEFCDLLSKQCDGITTLEEYFSSMNNKMLLKLTDSQTINMNFMANDVTIKYKNFKYNKFEHLPNDETLFGLFFNSTIMGARETRYDIRNKRGFSKNYESIIKCENLYFLEGDYKRNNLKLSYLKSQHNRYYLIRKNDFFNEVAIQKLFKNPLFGIDDVREVMDEYWEIIKANSTDFDSVIVPESFKLERKRRAKIDGEIVINIVSESRNIDTNRAKIASLIDFNGTIFYGAKEDYAELRKAANLMENVLNKQIINGYDNGSFCASYKSTGNNPKHQLMFAYVAKNNLKYFKDCKKAFDIQYFNVKMLYRYEEQFKDIYCSHKLYKLVEGMNKIFISKSFAEKYPNLSDEINLCHKIQKDHENINSYYLVKYFSDDMLKDNKKYEKYQESIEKIQKINDYFLKFMRYIDVPYYPENHPAFFDMIKALGSECELLK